LGYRGRGGDTPNTIEKSFAYMYIYYIYIYIYIYISHYDDIANLLIE
jgi:hypothetical protein